MDDQQLIFLINGLDAIYRFRRARQWPGFANKEAVEAATGASPKSIADTDYTGELLKEECEARGMEPPRYA